jgi:hypothetical protein
MSIPASFPLGRKPAPVGKRQFKPYEIVANFIAVKEIIFLFAEWPLLAWNVVQIYLTAVAPAKTVTINNH